MGRSLSESSIQEMSHNPYRHISGTYPKNQEIAMCLFFGSTLVNHPLYDMVFEWGISFSVLFLKGFSKLNVIPHFSFLQQFLYVPGNQNYKIMILLLKLMDSWVYQFK